MTCLIRYKGENVSTTEVAAVLGGFTDLRVAQCVVYVGCFWREYLIVLDYARLSASCTWAAFGASTRPLDGLSDGS